MIVERESLAAPDDRLLTATDLLLARERAAPDHAAFNVPEGDGWRQVSTAEFLTRVRDVARGFLAAGAGRGRAIVVMAPTRYEWAVADLAGWWVGATVVPIYETASPRQAAQVLADAEPVMVLAGGALEAAVLTAAADLLDGDPPEIWTLDAGPRDLDALSTLGHGVTEETLEARRAATRPEDVATIVYTSGTTGAARGVRITHANLVGVVRNVQAAYGELIHDRASTVIFLPLAHVLARGLQLVAMAAGMRVAHLADPKAVVATLPSLRPTFLVVAPRVLQRIRAAVAQRADQAHLGRLYAAADRTAMAWGAHLERLQDEPEVRPSAVLRAQHRLYDVLFYRRVRALLGGRVDYLLSGAASLGADLSRYFRGIGVPVIEGYGLTETTAPATGQLPGDLRAGTVGVPIPGTSVRIAADGEIQVRGIGVFPGYRDPQDDVGAFTDDGWFRTGDLGTLDARGHLTVVGRLKDTIVTASGKNIAPGPWETTVGAHPLVAHAVMVGTDRPYAGALLLLERDELRAWAEQHDQADLARLTQSPAGLPGVLLDDDTLMEALQSVVDAANRAVSRSEQVRRFRAVLTDLDAHTTPSLKLRRSAYLDSATGLVDGLYA